MDIYSNFLSIIQNGFKSKKLFVDVPKSRKLKKLILFFIKEGFFLGVEETKLKFDIFRIYLKYDGQKPVISGLIRVSKVSRPMFLKLSSLRRLYKPTYIIVLSTIKGYKNGFQALRENLGGEFFCIVY
jgi:small subunit ribosomal protein S8